MSEKWGIGKSPFSVTSTQNHKFPSIFSTIVMRDTHNVLMVHRICCLLLSYQSTTAGGILRVGVKTSISKLFLPSIKGWQHKNTATIIAFVTSYCHPTCRLGFCISQQCFETHQSKYDPGGKIFCIITVRGVSTRMWLDYLVIWQTLVPKSQVGFLIPSIIV